jgi:hypothetical protein
MSWLPNWITGYDAANADAAQAADAQLQTLNAQTYANDPTLAAIVAENRSRELLGTPDGSSTGIGAYDAKSQTADIQDAFQAQLDAEAKSFLGLPLGGLGSVLSALFKAVPVWLWLALGVGLFLWLGGAGLVRGLIAKDSKR